MQSPLSRRLKLAMSQMDAVPTNAELAKAAGVKPPSVTEWFNGKTMKLGKALIPVARLLNVNPEWLNEGKLPMRPIPGPEGSAQVAETHAIYGAGIEIRLINAPGSCGNGRGDMEDLPSVIIMDSRWFKERHLKADDLFAIRADGDANADYITHGDIVIFDSTFTNPETGQIFLLRHPDGLQIRRLRREIDGSWVLQYLNGDKLRFPDERVPAGQFDLLSIQGRFVYRQGG